MFVFLGYAGLFVMSTENLGNSIVLLANLIRQRIEQTSI